MRIVEMAERASAFASQLEEIKRDIAPGGFSFYPYGTLNNFIHLRRLLGESDVDLMALAADRPVADIGGADGDLAFFLERQGFTVEVIDHAPTNYNGLQGARAIKAATGSGVSITDIDLDAFCDLGDRAYGLVFFLGILYHLKNPYYVLNTLAQRSAHMFLSTRIARFTPDQRTDISPYQLAYLLRPDELNNDATNFWVFTMEALTVLLARTGWDIMHATSVGDNERSDPASLERDERAFVLARSRHAG